MDAPKPNKWKKKDTEDLNEMFVGNWHKEANKQNAQIYFAMSMDETGVVVIRSVRFDRKAIAAQLRSAADRIETGACNEGDKEFMFALN